MRAIEALLSALPDERRAGVGDVARLDAVLDAALASARSEGIAVPDTELVARFAAALAGDLPVVEALESLCHADLALALGCERGDARALSTVRSRYLEPALARAERRARAGADAVDETRAVLAEQLFVGSEKAPKAIAKYSGRGDLGSWLAVVATREHVRTAKRQKGRREVGDAGLADALGVGGDPVLDHVKATYRDEFRTAFLEALAELAPTDRNLLRYQFIDGLASEAIAALYGVHRATISRWLVRSREVLLENTRVRLMTRLGASAEEVESILFLVRSQIDLSLSRVLREADAPDP